MLRKAALTVAAAYALSSTLVTGAIAGPANPPSVGQPAPQFVVGGGHDTSFVPLAACRVVDTRTATTGKLRNRAAQTFHVSGTIEFSPQGGTAGGCGVPAWATAVTANISAVKANGDGYLRAWAAGSAEPTGNSLLLNKSIDQFAGVTIPISPSGALIKPYGGSTHFAMDVTGYYAPAIFAVVSSNGTLLYSSRLSVASHTIGSGSYVLTADTSVSSCSVIAAGWGTYSAAAYGSGTSIYVNTLQQNTQSADSYFQVTVTC